MKIAILSDIHANLAALEAVLAEIDRLEADKIWCLGDTAGYGPYPSECIAALKGYPLASVAGNHDLGVIGELDISGFNRDGQDAVEWQRPRLDEDALLYLRGLSLREKVSPEVTLVHGSPRNPVWEYLYTLGEARENFAEMETDIFFFGHTHIPVAFRLKADGEADAVFPRQGQPVTVGAGASWMINPGSVGQPRDGDPRASFVIFEEDEGMITWHRVDYDVEATRDAIRRFGLPQFLGDRLIRGV